MKNSQNLQNLLLNNHLGDVIETDCPPGGENDCCKQAEELRIAHEFLQSKEGANFEWVFVADDDVYILPDNLQTIVSMVNTTDRTGHVWGIPGCVTKNCQGLCGGGGYFFSRDVVDTMLMGTSHQFGSIRDEFMNFCKHCEDFGDMTFAHILKNRRGGMTLKPFPVTNYNWDMPEDKIITSLASGKDKQLPWLYHYPSRGRMYKIHDWVRQFGSNHEIKFDERDS